MDKTVRVPAALRTLQILQTLGRAGSPMTAQGLATKLDLPRSSVYQILEVLEEQGFVVHFPEEKRWSLGVAAFELGSAYLRHDPLERFAQPLLNRLLNQVGQLGGGSTSAQQNAGFAAVAQLGILDGAELLYLLKGSTLANASASLGSGVEVAVVTDVGVRLPAHLTASGRSLLALLPKQQFKALYPGGGDREITQRTPAGPPRVRDLEATLKADREAGCSVEIGEVTDGYASVASASVNHLGLPVAAFAVTFRTDRLTDAHLAALTTEIGRLTKVAATDLSRRLGAK